MNDLRGKITTMTKEAYLAPRTKTFYGDGVAVKATVTPILTSLHRISGIVDLHFFESGIKGTIDGDLISLLRPLVHKTDIHNCMNCFSAGTYRLHVFDDIKKALSYQELNYKKKSKGYIGLEKYLRGNRLI